uniref:Uncharacterized protein n=1 Tax=Cajanus cajan TaxID=3821 RepID=A0A151U262_CAJCA|nr:hypothetical protein KK1_006014 [Cajanus cajan]
MHDFCFTIPYGLMLVGGGLFGYIKKGSIASLGGGVASGLLLIVAGYLSLNAFGKRKNSYLALILETVVKRGCLDNIEWKGRINECMLPDQDMTGAAWFSSFHCVSDLDLAPDSVVFRTVYAMEHVCAAVLTWVMGQRYLETSKIMPAGLVAGISALMTLFYLYKLANGGNHLPTKAE